MVSTSAVFPGSSPRAGYAVADAADGRLDTGLGQALGAFDRDILAAAGAMVDQPATMFRPALVQRLLERIEHEGGMGRCG